jgi:ankyrin repeat protein
MMTTDETTTRSNNTTMLNTPPPEQDADALLKQYESMSYNEMSQRLAENYKQLSEILGNRISLPSATTTETEEDHHDRDDDHSHDDNTTVEDLDTLMKRNDLDMELKKKKLHKMFLKSVSSGDVTRLKEFLALKDDYLIDMDAKDEDGTTPLIYAACFGKFEIAQALLLTGAKIDVQDSRKYFFKEELERRLFYSFFVYSIIVIKMK